MFLEDPSSPRIGIIGAGFAGLRAACHFEKLGIDYTFIEGSNRIGGRVFPFNYQNGFLHYGAEYVNGFQNEIYQIVEKLQLLDKSESRTSDLWMLEEGTVTVLNGKLVDDEKLKIWNNFVRSTNEILYESSSMNPKKSVSEIIDENFSQFLKPNNFDDEGREEYKMLCEVFKNYFQTEWSSPVTELGLSNLDVWDDGTTVEDSAVLNDFGFQKILEELQHTIPKERIRLNLKVTNINYEEENENEGVKVHLESGDTLLFDSVIVTCSLGFLKKHNKQLFTPELPRDKEEAIERIGFGSNMKIFLEFESPWWPENTSTILIRNSMNADEPDSELLENLMVFQPSSWADNILVAWVAGNGPLRIASKSDLELRDLINNHLELNLKNQFNVQKAFRIFRHDWISDEFACGSYSFLSTKECDATDIAILGEPILRGNRPIVCFAGEHTDPEMYQTTVGAARSGLREAVRIVTQYANN